MPDLKTVSTFSISLMFFEGSPLIKTRSACLPGASVPIRSCWPRYFAPFTGDFNGFQRRESRFDQQFDFALIAETGQNAAVTGGIGAGEQQASRFREGGLKIHFLAQERGHLGVQRHSSTRREIALGGFRGHGIESALLQFWAAWRARFKHWER